MVFKKISCKKTQTGYSISVFVQDGRIVKPLYFGLCRFFDDWEKRERGQGSLDVRKLANDEAMALRGAVIQR